MEDKQKPKEATLAIIEVDRKILLGEKKKGEIGTGKLNGPGGKLDPGETLLDCVIRETREELGIELDRDHLKKVAIITFFAGGAPHMVVHVYCTDRYTGALMETADMIPDWFPKDNLPFERMHDGDRTWFDRAVQGERFCANVYYKTPGDDVVREPEFFPFEDLEETS